jgi:hypothetical protein
MIEDELFKNRRTEFTSIRPKPCHAPPRLAILSRAVPRLAVSLNLTFSFDNLAIYLRRNLWATT